MRAILSRSGLIWVAERPTLEADAVGATLQSDFSSVEAVAPIAREASTPIIRRISSPVRGRTSRTAPSNMPVPAEKSGADSQQDGHVYNLCLGELFQPLLPHFCANARLFGASQRHVGVHIKMLIDPYRAGIDFRGHRRGAIQIFCPDAPNEPVRSRTRSVSLRERFFAPALAGQEP